MKKALHREERCAARRGKQSLEEKGSAKKT